MAAARAIFLSYASEDALAARRIADALTAAGLTVWFDQSELRGGDAWDQQIRRKIKECTLFMPIISAGTQSRAEGYFRLEWHLAEQRTYLMAADHAFIVPVVIDDTPDELARVPERFRERQWTRLTAGTAGVDFLLRIQELLDGRSMSPAAAALKAAVANAGGNDRSVGVLPFANLSGDKENEYFSDGVTDELLNVLQQIPGLRVAARTSSFSFKGKAATAEEIGARLGVANLVEGSVQKSANRIKITARLSRAATGELRWSRSFTRELQDVFALQEELAQSIVAELRGQLEEGDNLAKLVHHAAQIGTSNPEAYQTYLLGKHAYAQFSSAGAAGALAHFDRAIELDPEFAAAWVGKAQAHSWVCGYDGALTRGQFEDHLRRAKAALARGQSINPDLPAALAMSHWIEFAFDFHWQSAEQSLHRGLQVAPNDPEILLMASRFSAGMGEPERALDFALRAAKLDPLNARTRFLLAQIYCMLGRFEEARREGELLAQISPSGNFTHDALALVCLWAGDYAGADALAQRGDDSWALLWVRSITAWQLGRRPEADEVLARLVKIHGDTAAIQIAVSHAQRGDGDRAFEWLERASVQKDPGLTIFAHLRFLESLWDDPRWSAFWLGIGWPSFGGQATKSGPQRAEAINRVPT